MKEINRTLPEGVVAKTVYDRTNLVNATLKTVRNNLLEGGEIPPNLKNAVDPFMCAH